MSERVSILVAAWNEAARIEQFVDSFQLLRYPNKHLILCAGGTDETWAIAKRLSTENITPLQQHAGEGKQRALRRGLDHIADGIVYLTDADCILDDDSFERTVAPLLAGKEQVATGRSRPYAYLLNHPFVALQAANNAYSDTSFRSDYARGLLGRNCAVTLSALQQSSGLAVEAPTGTDYVLAKMLLKASYKIRVVPESQIQSDFPTSARAYVQQQRRWLRNIAWHGWRFGAIDEVCSALVSSLLGLIMLALPLASFMFIPLWAVTIGIWGYVVRSRLRYLRDGAKVLGFRPNAQHVIRIPAHMLLDFVAWSCTLLDYFSTERRHQW